MELWRRQALENPTSHPDLILGLVKIKMIVSL